MDLVQSIIMGFVQGLSEFLPISSSGHLVFASNFYKVCNNLDIMEHANQEIFLDIMLHFGTLIAVLIFFRKEIFQIIKATYYGIKNKDFNDLDCKMGLYILLGTLFTIVIALPLNGIASKLVFSPKCVAILLFITGVLLLISEKISKKILNKKPIKLKEAILIGIAQGLAALPGFSRSGLTIATGLFCGVDRTTAAKYSFLLSIPIIIGSSMLYPLVAIDYNEFVTYNWISIIIGTIVSGISGYICIKYFIKFVSKFSLNIFGYYCILMSIFVFIFFIGR